MSEYEIAEALKGRMRATEISRETKSRLTEVFGRGNVSVRLDRGTAYGWVNARIKVPKPKDCECDNPEAPKQWGICLRCREEIDKARTLAQKVTKGIPFYSYTDDMGYEHDEFIVEIELVT